MDQLPPLIEDGKYCYCEVGGTLIYRDGQGDEHPAAVNLPRPDVTDLQRRAKHAQPNTDQFIETSGDGLEMDSMTQFKLTIESDGLIAATKGLALYNPYSLVLLSKLSEVSELIHRAMPTKLSVILSAWYQKEIQHHDAPGLVSCCDWHPRIDKLAVALKDDTIKIFYAQGNNLIPLLKHKRQVAINKVAWKALVDDTLAVGCHDCCILWTIDPSSLSARPGSGCAQVITSPSDQPIHSLSWDPSSCLLATASKKSSKLEIWDSDREELIYRKQGLTAVSLVHFSPNGARLLLCGRNTLTVFECAQWTSESWSNFEDTVYHAAWSSCGTQLIFAVKNKIFCLAFNTMSGGESEAQLLYELPYDIRLLAWSGDRLAVSMDAPEITAILLFNTQLKPSGQLCADVNGWLPTDEHASIMRFKSFKYGSMLSVISPTGSFTNIPLLYLNGGHQLNNEKVYEANSYIHDTLSNLDITTFDSFGMIQTSFSQH